MLSGERGEYELANGRSAGLYLQAMADAANDGYFVPEQVWDRMDISCFMIGRPTGSAAPPTGPRANIFALLSRSMPVENGGRIYEGLPHLCGEIGETEVHRLDWSIVQQGLITIKAHEVKFRERVTASKIFSGILRNLRLNSVDRRLDHPAAWTIQSDVYCPPGGSNMTQGIPVGFSGCVRRSLRGEGRES